MLSVLRGLSVNQIWALALASTLALMGGAPPAHAQGDGGVEEFEEVDPYTQGDRGLEEALGYVSVGSFMWRGSERTEHVQATMGGLDFLWVETEHFRIGSSLTSYKLPNHKGERARIKAEFKVLKKKLGKFKGPRKVLDPWIRLHLYALRAELAYDQYVETMGLDSMAEDADAPYLGHPHKFLLLLCQRRSELGRYLKAYHDTSNDFAFRTGYLNDGMFFGLNSEIIVEGFGGAAGLPFDTMLHVRVVENLTRNFVDGHRQRIFEAPDWFSTGLAHYFTRQIDPEWVTAGAGSYATNPDQWAWGERVQSLVKNDFFAKMPEIFDWKSEDERPERDHMVLWAKMKFLLDDVKGDPGAFLDAVVGSGDPKAPAPPVAEAFETHFGLSPESFDERFKKWVKDL